MSIQDAATQWGMREHTMLVIDYAQRFTLAKGRMPFDVHELREWLREWLREFAKFETERANLIAKAYEEHITVTPMKPIVIVGEHKNPEKTLTKPE